MHVKMYDEQEVLFLRIQPGQENVQFKQGMQNKRWKSWRLFILQKNPGTMKSGNPG